MKQVISVFSGRKHGNLYFPQVVLSRFSLIFSLKYTWMLQLRQLKQFFECQSNSFSRFVFFLTSLSGKAALFLRHQRWLYPCKQSEWPVLCLPRRTGKTLFLVLTFVLCCKERAAGGRGEGWARHAGPSAGSRGDGTAGPVASGSCIGAWRAPLSFQSSPCLDKAASCWQGLTGLQLLLQCPPEDMSHSFLMVNE